MSDKLLDKKTRFKSWLIYFLFSTAGWNWERMQHIAFCLGMSPVLKKLYPDDKEKFTERLSAHMAFYNTEPQSSSIVGGLTAALEEKMVDNSDVTPDSINSVKTGIMGPLAGIGDSMIASLLNTILLSIGISMAMQGNLAGPFVFLFSYGIIVTWLSWFLYERCYAAGADTLTLLTGDKIKSLVEGLSILGLIVIGGLTAQYVSLNTAIVYGMGETKLQDTLNGILPALLPLLLTILVYWLISKKRVPTLVIIVGIFVVGIVLSVLGII